MAKVSRAAGGALCLMLAVPGQAAPLKVTPGNRPPEAFYAVPAFKVRPHLDNWLRLRRKITCCSWGPHGFAARPNTAPDQWYIFPVCGGAVQPVARLIEPSQTEETLSCP